MKPGFMSARYTRLGYIHLAFKGRRKINNSLSTSEIKNSCKLIQPQEAGLMIPPNGNMVHNIKLWIKENKDYCFLLQYILDIVYFTFNFTVQKTLLKEQLYLIIFLFDRADVLKRLMY